MSALTDKYGGMYMYAEKQGCTNMSAQEDNGHMTITMTAPTQLIANRVWDAAKEADPDLDDGDLTLNISVERTDIHGIYEVEKGDTLSAIAKHVTGSQLTYMQIFEANRNILSDPNKIQIGQKLTIPKLPS